MPASTTSIDVTVVAIVQSSADPSSKLGLLKNWTVFSEQDTMGVTLDATGTSCARSASQGRLRPRVEIIAMTQRASAIASKCVE